MTRAQVPVYEVTPVESTIKFGVESSVPIKGTFEKWNASMKFSSADVRNGVLEIEIQADSVDTGSGLKNRLCTRIRRGPHFKPLSEER
jgi:polyisoprenoid-binding protein YceI